MNKWYRALVVGVLGVWVAGWCGGCCYSKVVRHDLALGATDLASSVEVDVVGSTEMTYWQGIEKKDWFAPGSQLRNGTKHVTLHFGERQPAQQMLDNTRRDWLESWQRWQFEGVQYLVVMADLPSTKERSWMQILPMDRCRWSGTRVARNRVIELRLTTAGIQVLTPPLPPKQ